MFNAYNVLNILKYIKPYNGTAVLYKPMATSILATSAMATSVMATSVPLSQVVNLRCRLYGTT